MLNKIYYWFHNITSKPEERGEYSSGHWQEEVRAQAINFCRINAGNLLDVGCGEGLFLTKAAENFPHLQFHGIDRWQDILDKAKAKVEDHHLTNVHLSHADATRIPYEDNFFDVIVCINVFFNLPSDDVFDQVFKEISRVSKTEGRMIFDIRNRLNPLLCIKYKLAKYYDETVKDLPLRTYRLQDVEAVLRKYNFQITKKTPLSFPKNKWAPIIVIEAQKGGPS